MTVEAFAEACVDGFNEGGLFGVFHIAASGVAVIFCTADGGDPNNSVVGIGKTRGALTAGSDGTYQCNTQNKG